MRDRSDWMLHLQVFKAIKRATGPLQVDLFASRLTHQLPDYVSWRECNSNGCLFPRLDKVPDHICKPTMESDRESLEHDKATKNKTSANSTSVVSYTSVNANTNPTPTPGNTKPNSSDTQCQSTRHNPTHGRVGYLRDRFRSQNLNFRGSFRPPPGFMETKVIKDI